MGSKGAAEPMNRGELEEWIAGTYGADGDHPWAKYPEHTVFRHRSSRKWFALVLTIPRGKLGLAGGGTVEIVNVKCDPVMTGSLRMTPGIYPAYHMNKDSWVTIALDGSVEDEMIKMLLDMSFELTAPKVKRPRARPEAAAE